MIKRFILIPVLLFKLIFLSAQLNPDDCPILFQEETIPRIDIFIEPDSLAILLEDITTDHEYPATFVYNNHTGIQDTIENIGFRIRGNVSRTQEKKSFKVSFNTFESGSKYYGYEKLNLKGTGDDSFVRPKIAWKVCREMGIPFSWVSHVELYINNELWGLYANTEHIDEEYIQKQFGNNNGNLYKCRYPASLEDRGIMPDDYKFENEYFGERSIRVYELKTNTDEDDYSDLVELVIELVNNSGEDFGERISKRINLVNLIKFFAVEVYLGHWDSYSISANNYFLYHNQQTDKFEYITYDMDLTMGIKFGGPEPSELDIYNYFSAPEMRPLRYKILEVPEFRDQYTYYLRQLTDRFPPDTLAKYGQSVQQKIASFVEQDPFYPYTMDEFEGALESPIGFAYMGVVEFLDSTYVKILEQLDNSNTAPIVHSVKFTDCFKEDTILIRCTVDDDDPSVDVNICYSLNGGEIECLPMELETVGNMSGEVHYQVKINPVNVAGKVEFYITAIDAQQQEGINPYNGVHTVNVYSDDPDLRINEVFASNTACMTDEFGERDDWIEIINMDDEPVSLKDIYMSDNRDNYDEWRLPALILQPGEVAWFWADNDTEQGDNHASFKLSKNGETAYLFQKFGNVFLLLDSLNFPEQESNSSYGLYPGNPEIVANLAQTTPGFPNNTRNLAFLSFDVDMNSMLEANRFNTSDDALDIVVEYSDWSIPFTLFDTDSNSVYSQSVYDLTANHILSYSLRINGDDNLAQYGIENPKAYLLQEGCNLIDLFPQVIESVSQDLLPDTDITLYPNPVTDFASVRLETPGKEVKIINSNGTLVRQFRINDLAFTFDTRDLRPGIYILQVTLEDNTLKTVRMVKQ